MDKGIEGLISGNHCLRHRTDEILSHPNHHRLIFGRQTSATRPDQANSSSWELACSASSLGSGRSFSSRGIKCYTPSAASPRPYTARRAPPRPCTGRS